MRILLLFCAFAISQQGLSQTGMINLSNYNILYVGLKTPSTFIATDKRGKIAKNPVLKSSDNIRIIKNDSQTIIQPLSRGVGYIYVGFIKKHDTIWTGSYAYRIKPIPMQQVRYGTIQNGSTTPKAAIAMQSSLRLDYGYGMQGLIFSSNWVILSYRISIANVLTYNTSRHDGPEIPDSIKRRISSSLGGKLLVDSILIQNKNNGQIRKMQPIMLTLDDSPHYNSIRYINASIINQSGEKKEFKEISRHSDITDIFEKIDSGIISVYGFNYRIDKYYKDAINTRKVYFNDVGKLKYDMSLIGNKRWNFIQKDEEGKITVVTEVNDSLTMYHTIILPNLQPKG